VAVMLAVMVLSAMAMERFFQLAWVLVDLPTRILITLLRFRKSATMPPLMVPTLTATPFVAKK
jgi:hypothetical protein